MVNRKFVTVLGVISMLGFLSIIIKATSGFDVAAWVEPLMFLIMGAYLMVEGGYHLIFTYVEGGLTAREVNKIVTVIVGFTSVTIGILTSPVLNINFDIFNGFKVIIASIALVAIFLELTFKEN